MSEEIKPCPFCGSEAEPYPDGPWEGYSIMCKGDCSGTRFGYLTHEESVTEWNKRSSDSEIATLTAKLAESEHHRSGFAGLYLERGEEIHALKQQLAEAQKDAERYRWLRSQSDEVINAEYEVCRRYGHAFYPLTAMLDSAIDSEMSK
jgi:hypothetical protein